MTQFQDDVDYVILAGVGGICQGDVVRYQNLTVGQLAIIVGMDVVADETRTDPTDGFRVTRNDTGASFFSGGPPSAGQYWAWRGFMPIPHLIQVTFFVNGATGADCFWNWTMWGLLVPDYENPLS